MAATTVSISGPTAASSSTSASAASTSVTELLSSANDLLARHAALISRVRDDQSTRRRELRALASPPQAVLDLSPIASPREGRSRSRSRRASRSPSHSRSPSPPSTLQTLQQYQRSLTRQPNSHLREDLPPAKRARVARYANYVPEEETIRNDYSQRYVDGGEWPQNWVLGAELERRFEEYPKQQRLLTLKKAMVAEYALPPTYLAMADLHVLTASSSHSRTSSLTLPPPITQPQPQQQQTQPQQPTGERQASPSPLKSPTTIQHPLPNPPSTTANLLASPAPTHASASSLTHLIPLPTGPCKFDVILIDPPFSSSFSWDHLEKLPIPQLAADPSYVFLWVGSGAGEGLERGREVLGRWGYRRCEDVVWVKTNWDSCKGPGTDPPTTSLLTRTKQHCLMGIRGTVKRSTDSWFVHCNIDTDVIIWSGDPSDPSRKPPEMYQLIENFCLGTRRLEVFGRMSSLRRGWVTMTAEPLPLAVDKDVDMSKEGEGDKERNEGETGVEAVGAIPFERERWEREIREMAAKTGGKCVVPNSTEIENLRPKSPVPRGGASGMASHSTGVGGGGGTGGGVPLSIGMGMGGTHQSQGMGMMNVGGLPRNPHQNPNFGIQNYGGGGGGGRMMGQGQGQGQPIGMMAAMGMNGMDGMGAANSMSGMGMGNVGVVNPMGGLGSANMGGMGMGGGLNAAAMNGMARWHAGLQNVQGMGMGQNNFGFGGMGMDGGGGMGGMGGGMGGMGGMGMMGHVNMNLMGQQQGGGGFGMGFDGGQQGGWNASGMDEFDGTQQQQQQQQGGFMGQNMGMWGGNNNAGMGQWPGQFR